MDNNKQSQLFLFICLAGTFIAVYYIIQPFLAALLLAAVFAFLFHPIFRKISTYLKGWQSLSAFLTMIIGFILVIIPAYFLGNMIFQEFKQIYNSILHGGSGSSFLAKIETLLTAFQQYIPNSEEFKIDFKQYLQQILEGIIKGFASAFSSIAKIAISLIVFFFSFFFLLRDGKELIKYFITYSPLNKEDNKLIVLRVKSVIYSVVRGNLSVGLIQGVLSTTGFYLFGVPNAILLGSITAIFGLIPSGTNVVTLPAIIFLLVTGKTYSAIGLFVWSLTASITVDNFISPKLIGRGLNLHPLAVFLSVIGGITLFGALGILLGPLFLSLLLVFIEMTRKIKKSNT